MGFLVCAIEAFPDKLSTSEEAKSFIRTRRRASGRCFNKRVCQNFEEFAEDAENEFGEDIVREKNSGLYDQVVENYNTMYLECHKEQPDCIQKKKECECNRA